MVLPLFPACIYINFRRSVAKLWHPIEINTSIFYRSQGKAVDVNLITTDDISAFIIPPPPSSGNNDSGLEVLRRLYEAKEGIFQVRIVFVSIYLERHVLYKI